MRARERRFWKKATIDPDGCWEWQEKSRKYNEYGLVEWRGHTVLAHRLAYSLYNEVPLRAMRGKVVLHACDNPPCIRPDHLSLNTQQSNIDDMVAKGRQAKGERNGASKLTPDEVLAIRYYASQGYANDDLAAAYHITPQNVGAIVARKTWKWLEETDGPNTEAGSGGTDSPDRDAGDGLGTQERRRQATGRRLDEPRDAGDRDRPDECGAPEPREYTEECAYADDAVW